MRAPSYVGLLALWFVFGCNRNEVRQFDAGVDFVVLQEWRQQKLDDWQVEAWLSGTSVSRGYPMPLHLRLIGLNNQKTLPSIKAKISLKDKKSGKEYLNEISADSVALMKSEREESKRINNRFEGIILFKPPEACWEILFKKIQSSEWKTLDYGDYSLKVTVVLAEKINVEFDAMPIELYNRSMKMGR